MQTLFVATSNPGKLRDFAAVPSDEFRLVPLPNLASVPEPEESALTFAGNARLKALAYSHLAPSEIVIADDSGIELDALGGAPGVRSARYAQDNAFAPSSFLSQDLSKDELNNLCLLQNAASLTGNGRGARYCCVLAAARNGDILTYGHGTLEGLLLDQPRGESGFGYDPIFLIPQLNQTMAELTPETRLHYSHRIRAFGDLLNRLRWKGITEIAQTER
jgi:XTP/dITP diphosphohydrolase